MQSQPKVWRPESSAARKYCKAGADMIFAEALTELDQIPKVREVVKVPVLANITEFGKNSAVYG